MFKSVLLLFFTSITLYASITLSMHSGWQLVGLGTQVDNMSIFDDKNVEIVWAYDAPTQSWQGYSPDENLSQGIEDAGYVPLQSLQPYQAVWIYNKGSWSLNVTTKTSQTEYLNGTMELSSGWNLLALPQQSVISTGIFKDATVWKYDESWSFYSSDAELPFPKAESVSASEGFWVKVQSDQSIDLAKASSELHTFENSETMKAFIRDMVLKSGYSYYGYLERPIAVDGEFSSSSASTDDFSAKDVTTTNVQENGVDEGDIVKNDDTHIFYVDQSGSTINVTSFERVKAGEYKPFNTIALANAAQVQAMYLYNGRLVVIATRYMYDIATDMPETRSLLPYYGNNSYSITTYDVSNVHAISTLHTHEIEGSYQQSRMVDGALYVVNQFYPYVQIQYPKIEITGECVSLYQGFTQWEQDEMIGVSSLGGNTMMDDGYAQSYKRYEELGCYQYFADADGKLYRYDYENPEVIDEHLTPGMVNDGVSSELLEAQRFYAPYKLDQRANITTLIHFDVDAGSFENATSFIGNVHQYYASSGSFYMLSSEYPYYYDFENYEERVSIYKFALDESLDFKAKGSVKGTVLNQFSLSEHEGILRIATTANNWWNRDDITNQLYTLQEDAGTLSALGTLEGLGKPRESIKAVRFVGDRGYVVTFETKDPLYTIDLSDASYPKKVGELEIEGFSEYFHPVDEERILSIGRDADSEGNRGGLMLQLFDVSDFSDPQRVDKVVIGDSGTYSSAEYDHKAFTYRSSDALFGFPYQSYGALFVDEKGGIYQNIQRYGLYQVDGMALKHRKTLVSEHNGWSYGNGRGIFFSDDANVSYVLYIKEGNLLCESIEEGE